MFAFKSIDAGLPRFTEVLPCPKYQNVESKSVLNFECVMYFLYFFSSEAIRNTKLNCTLLLGVINYKILG